MTTVNKSKIEKILNSHKKWVESFGNRGFRADFSNMNLSYFNFSGKELSRADFSGSNLAGADFSGANLHQAIFRNSDVSHANFIGTDLIASDFVGANLFGAYLPAKTKIIDDELSYIVLTSDYARVGFLSQPVEFWRKHITKDEVLKNCGESGIEFLRNLMNIFDEHYGAGEQPTWLGELS